MFNNDYLNANKIPQLFKALSDSLVMTQPSDCLVHLQEALFRVDSVGLETFVHETFHRGGEPLCLKGLIKCKTAPIDSNADAVVDDYRVLLLISSPGEIKPLGRKLTKIYSNCGYINVGKCLRKRIKMESQKGISRWKVSKSLLSNGDFVPEDIVLDVLLDEMKKHKSKALIIIEGYPKNMKQINDLDNAIGLGRVLRVFAIDSFENESVDVLINSLESKVHEPDCKPYSIARRMAYYKAFTLPVLKYFQDINKLELVQKPKNDLKIFKQVTALLKEQLPGIIKATFGMKTSEDHYLRIQETRKKIEDGQMIFNYSSSRLIYNSLQLYSIPEPKMRKYDLAKIPLVLLNGSPKSGKTTLARKLCKMLPGWYHYDCSLHRANIMEEQKELTIKNICCRIYNDLDVISSFAIGIFIENFPSSESELRMFNEEIGHVDLQIFLDVSNYNISIRYLQKESTEEHHLDHSLIYKSSSAVEELLKYYEQMILPTIRYFSDRNISFNINGNQDEEKISAQVENVIRSIYY